MQKLPITHMILSPAELNAFLQARVADPHRLLGLHPFSSGKKKGLVGRIFATGATTCELVDRANPKNTYPLECIDKAGFFEGLILTQPTPFPYWVKLTYPDGSMKQGADPYSFMPTLTSEDLHYFAEGTHHHIYEKLGAHIKTHDGITGVAFAVWAPSAKRISVVGDFNHWDGRLHPMRMLGGSGVWELFIPGLEAGQKYKYELIGEGNALFLKTDPYGLLFESPPHNASVIYDLSAYQWKDESWMQSRKTRPWHEEPISIYELHHGSWRAVVEDGDRPLSYREMAVALAAYVKEMGFTHVEFMPLAEHPFAGSWGYQVTGFFAPTHRFGEPDDFRFLVDTLHQNGIGVIIDWVPAHFPKDAFALAKFDGTCLYEHADPRQGEHKDWGTLIFNYERSEVRNFLITSALSWFDRYHIDGLRVDAVASMIYLDYSREEGEWIPNAYGGKENLGALHFIRETNSLVHHYYPGALMIAEESTSWNGVTRDVKDKGLGFDFKWNMGWMHDVLVYFQKDPIYRPWHHHQLTFGMLYQYSENFVSVFSHDEVVHGKGSMMGKMAGGSMSEKARALRALYAYQWGWPGKKGLFMGQEWGQSREWAYDKSLDWHLLQYLDHSGLQHLVKDLNAWYNNSPGLASKDHHPAGFEWIEVGDAQNSVLSFARFGHKPEDTVLIIGNFTPALYTDYRIGAPFQGYWKEVINTDAAIYGGWGHGNLGGKNTDEHPFHGRPGSLSLVLPPMSVLILQYQGQK